MDAQAGWVAVGIAAVSMFGSSFALFVGWLTKRTDKEIAVKTAIMNERMRLQEEQLQHLKVELKNCQTQHHESEQDRNELRERIDQLQDLIERYQQGGSK
jgi:septal ring factor EnvC (AmiA/AmiB activator)